MSYRIPHQYFEELCDDFAGFCLVCQDITREFDTEPDAEEYECPVCGTDSVYGIEECLIRGWIEVTEDDYE